MSRNPGRLGAALLLLISACDPGFAVRGQIVDLTGKPVPDAKVGLNCKGVVYPDAISNERGRFSLSAIGWRSNSCVIEVDMRGRPSLRFLLGEHCAQPHGNDACLGAWLDLVVPSL